MSLLTGCLTQLPADMGADGELDPAYLRQALVEPAYDILRRHGKGFRSVLVERCWALSGTTEELPEALPLVVELLHAGSLIIDDIEDGSLTRRGDVALHRRYGVPVALNTGNWLYFLPLALISGLRYPPDLKMALSSEISHAVLLSHQGQALDLSVQIAAVPREAVSRIVHQAALMKTGSLMRLCARIAARAGGATPARLHSLSRFGSRLGLGLQMLDDWSGIVSEARRDKGIEDLRHQRPSWAWVWLATHATRQEYVHLARLAQHARTPGQLEDLRQRLRTHLKSVAPDQVHRHLTAALRRLSEELGPSSSLDALSEDMARLEESYG